MNANLKNVTDKKIYEKDDGYIIIPKKILQDPLLTPTCKLLLGTLISLDNENGCFASNAYLAKVCNLNITTCSLSVSKLKNMNYISVFYEYHSPSSSKIDKRNIHVFKERCNFKPNNKNNKNNFNTMLKKITKTAWRNS